MTWLQDAADAAWAAARIEEHSTTMLYTYSAAFGTYFREHCQGTFSARRCRMLTALHMLFDPRMQHAVAINERRALDQAARIACLYDDSDRRNNAVQAELFAALPTPLLKAGLSCDWSLIRYNVQRELNRRDRANFLQAKPFLLSVIGRDPCGIVDQFLPA